MSPRKYAARGLLPGVLNRADLRRRHPVRRQPEPRLAGAILAGQLEAEQGVVPAIDRPRELQRRPPELDGARECVARGGPRGVGGPLDQARDTALPEPAARSRQTCPRLLTAASVGGARSEEHTSELQSLAYLVCRLL